MSESLKPTNISQETAVDIAPRFSLACAEIGRTDQKAGYGFYTARRISYDIGSPANNVVFRQMSDQGFVLGQEISSNNANKRHVQIPGSSRPLAYDRPLDPRNIHDYNDSRLFGDMGGILGKLAYLDTTGYEITGDIAQHIAMVNFTKKGERVLWLVPGFERYTAEVTDGSSALQEKYAVRLTTEFGERFLEHKSDFIEGFEKGI